MKSHLAYPFVVQYFDGCHQRCHAKVEAQVRKAKGSQYSVINGNHALVHANAQVIQDISNFHQHEIKDFAPLLPSLKVDSHVHDNDACASADDPTTAIVPYHVVFSPITQEEINSLIKNAPEEWHSHILTGEEEGAVSGSPFMAQFDELQVSTRSSTVLISTPCAIADDMLAYLADQNFVQWIEVRPEMKFLSEWANGITQSGDDTVEILQIANLTGAGEIMGIADTGLDMMSCFFHDSQVEPPYDKVDYSHRKVIYYNTHADDTDSDGHGTLVCGTAAGRDQSGGLGSSNGAAFKSKISFFDIGKLNGALTLPANINTNLFTVLYDTGAKVQSMSWGSYTDRYTNDARNVDIFMWEHPDALVLVAGGNSGEDGPGSIGSPATNKNGVAVGANLNSESSWETFGQTKGTDFYSEQSLAYFSSRGPTADGRTKPDVCGVGWYVTGAESKFPVSSGEHCSTSSSMGTSFACPLLAAHALLAREYFISGYYPSGARDPANGFEPSGALLKAVLVHGAEKLKQVQLPDGSTEKTEIDRGDNNQGYGRAQLNNALSFGVNASLEGLTYFVLGAADSSSEHYVEISGGDNTHEYTFRTAVNPTKPIRVTLAYTDYYGPAGATDVMINDLDLLLSDGTNTYYPLITNADGKYDRLNNMEVILLFDPPSNTTFTVTVTAFSVSVTQPYALIISGELGEYPYSKKNNNFLLYVAAVIMVLVFGGCCVLTVAACISKKNAKDLKNKKSAVSPEFDDAQTINAP